MRGIDVPDGRGAPSPPPLANAALLAPAASAEKDATRHRPRLAEGRQPSIMGLASVAESWNEDAKDQFQWFGVHFDPLYLFHCALLWHKHGETTAGWELAHGLRSWHRESRAVAAAMLARTKHMRLRAREVRSKLGASDADRIFIESEPEVAGELDVNTPYGLEIVESCLTCKLRKEKWFCRLPPEALRALSDATRPCTYPGDALLFVEGQASRGAFVLCSGKVKLSATSREGKVVILKVADAGEVLGLSAVLTGECYEVTAETAGPCQVNFVEREALLRLMERYGELGARAALSLSREFQSVYRDIHDLVLARSSAGKLAKLLLSWSAARGRDNISSGLTHEEMAQMIGASRETVTRLLSDLKKKELIRLEGSTLIIRNRTALEALAA